MTQSTSSSNSGYPCALIQEGSIEDHLSTTKSFVYEMVPIYSTLHTARFAYRIGDTVYIRDFPAGRDVSPLPPSFIKLQAERTQLNPSNIRLTKTIFSLPSGHLLVWSAYKGKLSFVVPYKVDGDLPKGKLPAWPVPGEPFKVSELSNVVYLKNERVAVGYHDRKGRYLFKIKIWNINTGKQEKFKYDFPIGSHLLGGCNRATIAVHRCQSGENNMSPAPRGIELYDAVGEHTLLRKFTTLECIPDFRQSYRLWPEGNVVVPASLKDMGYHRQLLIIQSDKELIQSGWADHAAESNLGCYDGQICCWDRRSHRCRWLSITTGGKVDCNQELDDPSLINSCSLPDGRDIVIQHHEEGGKHSLRIRKLWLLQESVHVCPQKGDFLGESTAELVERGMYYLLLKAERVKPLLAELELENPDGVAEDLIAAFQHQQWHRDHSHFLQRDVLLYLLEHHQLEVMPALFCRAVEHLKHGTPLNLRLVELMLNQAKTLEMAHMPLSLCTLLYRTSEDPKSRKLISKLTFYGFLRCAKELPFDDEEFLRVGKFMTMSSRAAELGIITSDHKNAIDTAATANKIFADRRFKDLVERVDVAYDRLDTLERRIDRTDHCLDELKQAIKAEKKRQLAFSIVQAVLVFGGGQLVKAVSSCIDLASIHKVGAGLLGMKPEDVKKLGKKGRDLLVKAVSKKIAKAVPGVDPQEFINTWIEADHMLGESHEYVDSAGPEPVDSSSPSAPNPLHGEMGLQMRQTSDGFEIASLQSVVDAGDGKEEADSVIQLRNDAPTRAVLEHIAEHLDIPGVKLECKTQ